VTTHIPNICSHFSAVESWWEELVGQEESSR